MILYTNIYDLKKKKIKLNVIIKKDNNCIYQRFISYRCYLFSYEK